MTLEMFTEVENGIYNRGEIPEDLKKKFFYDAAKGIRRE